MMPMLFSPIDLPLNRICNDFVWKACKKTRKERHKYCIGGLNDGHHQWKYLAQSHPCESRAGKVQGKEKMEAARLLSIRQLRFHHVFLAVVNVLSCLAPSRTNKRRRFDLSSSCREKAFFAIVGDWESNKDKWTLVNLSSRMAFYIFLSGDFETQSNRLRGGEMRRRERERESKEEVEGAEDARLTAVLLVHFAPCK